LRFNQVIDLIDAITQVYHRLIQFKASIDMSVVKSTIKQIIPTSIWSKLRLWNLQRKVARFPARRVQHLYGGHRLEIQLLDGLAAGWYDHDWEELPEIAVLRSHRLKPGARVFDLGAHQGVVALMLAREVGPEGQVIAVEANPHNQRVALLNRDLNNSPQIQVVHAAVADTRGTLVFNQGLNGQVDDGEGAWGEIEVASRTIDDLAREYGTPDVLFIDVEGFECHALRGAKETLESRPDCFVEVHVNHGLEKFGGSVDSVLQFFPRDEYQFQIAQENHNQGRFEPYQPESPLIKDRFFLLALHKGSPPTSGRNG